MSRQVACAPVSKAVSLAVTLVLVAANCSSGDEAGSTSSTTSTSTSEATTTMDEATTSTSVSTATVNQIASVVAERGPPVRESIEDADPCFIDPGCSLAASISVLSVGTTAGTLALDAADDDRPENGLFIGGIPDEIADLTAETVDAANAVADAANGLDVTCPGPNAGPECFSTMLELGHLAGDLVDELNAWEPYL